MRSSKRLSVLALVVVAAGMSLTACGPDDSSASGTTASPSAPGATSSPSAAPGQDSSSSGGSGDGSSSGSSDGSGGTTGGSGSSNGGSSNDGSAAGTMCKTSNLAISAEHGISGEGMELIHFKNTGSSSCTMHGFAGIDLKSGTDTVNVARRPGSEVPTVKLAPGERTEAVLYYPFNNSGGSGYTFTTMTVTPPNETHSTSVGATVNIPLDNPDENVQTTQIHMNAVGAGK
ncbi:DUF4232 domain-containing protein [Streptomyces sp. CBMA29]|uniref:DUF4232 domain-containing protein n=1 Tax=Streptomyces sp. CBMA29 TaxID=1896314 RepID=UPI00166192BF|nr:DUF4232 domain-containing protein [Streptomyces sp. CBMA29]MBD0735943.1 hypothetical protein [Streptomyces sp. CBMA29]